MALECLICGVKMKDKHHYLTCSEECKRKLNNLVSRVKNNKKRLPVEINDYQAKTWYREKHSKMSERMLKKRERENVKLNMKADDILAERNRRILEYKSSSFSKRS